MQLEYSLQGMSHCARICNLGNFQNARKKIEASIQIGMKKIRSKFPRSAA